MSNSLLWNEYKISPSIELKRKIMSSYTKLIYYVIHNSRFTCPDILDDRDFFQFGIEGLSEAVDRFDPDFGTKFETYAIQRIRGKIIDELRKVRKNKSREDFIITEIPIDTPIDDENSYSLSEILPGDSTIPDKEYEKNETIELLASAVRELPERERLIISLYYYEHLNYQDIGKLLNITVSRVSQVHSRVIKSLRSKLQCLNYE
jgi:RNA polymerase sigma factor FliA